MKTKIYLFLFLILCYTSLVAQIRTTPNTVGSRIVIPSVILDQEREIHVYLPDGYETSDQKFPVLYILDGQRYFLHAVSLQKSFVSFKQAPEFIVVGINKQPSDRNQLYSANADNYLTFIKDEVITYIDATYKTAGDRMLFGWAFAGGFVIETLLQEPDLFQSFITASPFPLASKTPKVDSLLKANTNLRKNLFVTVGSQEGSVKEGVATLHELLGKNTSSRLNWTVTELQGEEHRSTPFSTLYHGIKRHFEYYPELEFSNLEQFINAGELPFVYEYYKKRASRYGFSEALTDWTMFSLVRNAIRADSFSHFETLEKAFRATGYIGRLRSSRGCSIAEFYLANQKTEKARQLFEEISKAHPSSERALRGIGTTYQAENKEKKAKEFFKKAEELSKTN